MALRRSEGIDVGRSGDDDGSGVQSVVRALRLLECMSEAEGGLSLNDLSAEAQLPAATSHRLLRTLSGLGYVRQLGSRRYALGVRAVSLARAADSYLSALAAPHLERLVGEIGETANLGLLDRDRIVYVAQSPSPHSMRTFTEVGRRVMPHDTGVGKAILAELTPEAVRRIIGKIGLPASTPTTITDLDAFESELAGIRDRGFAVDEGEHEVGVRCYAVALRGVAAPMAVSVSGPAARLTDDVVSRVVPSLRAVAEDLARELTGV